ncbi:winged helix DNA-binding domain-containing protein [Streptacidiphilus sp. ASG 303]|uniref:winged helix DNA-binding domain-containing protein n=1 Tax=Streptacidiphilus sp. ASG 303 TaxID=2896847 RepID=UPI001E5370F4|nr:winged helix DNA-binding domain-containing protein [Streptacidiphilus sp. ASG 303]MCD0482176.1 winged helix DNA-binding domain-containing protein [Streptacidiphilus sp. ASG 303]
MTDTRGGTRHSPVLGRRSLGRALLDRQLLVERRPLPALEVVEHLVGLQAQDPKPPYTGLWSRVADFRPDELSRLLEERAVVRIALMRGTIHLVSAADCLALRPLLQARSERTAHSRWGRELAGVDPAELAAAGRALVEERPLTFESLGALLAERWPGRDPYALAMTVRCLLPLVQVPPRGLWGATGPAAHTTAEAWLGRSAAAAPPAPPVPAVDALVLRYLAAFGPATVADVQKWSGLTGLREVLERLRSRLLRFRDEGGAELFDLPEAPRPDPDTPVPVRLLAEFDNLLLAHADRGRVLPEAYRMRVMTRNGLVRGSVLADGSVRGVWRLLRERDAGPSLRVELFEPLSAADRDALEREGRRLLAFSRLPGAASPARNRSGGAAGDVSAGDERAGRGRTDCSRAADGRTGGRAGGSAGAGDTGGEVIVVESD